jgi:hypothetical protein
MNKSRKTEGRSQKYLDSGLQTPDFGPSLQ